MAPEKNRGNLGPSISGILGHPILGHPILGHPILGHPIFIKIRHDQDVKGYTNPCICAYLAYLMMIAHPKQNKA